jgi:L-aspartate oxidase
MRRADVEVTHTDVLVIGSGAAGLISALQAASHGAKVLIISATTPAGSSSELAQGGIAAAIDDDDAPALHAADTLSAGRGLCSLDAVTVLVGEGPAAILRLQQMGVPFGDEAGLEGGHSRRRIHQAGGSRTGHVVVSALVKLVRQEARICLASPERACALSTSSRRCIGARTNRRLIIARSTVLATGGYAALYARTTNPPGSRGEGLLLAYEAGAELIDLEFVQFHPTVLDGSSLLLTEALRGEGAVLLDEHGERFTAELAPRDELARAIAARGRAYLDLRNIDREKFSSLMRLIAQAGYDPVRAPIPVSPAAHYTMGGIRTDIDGRTSLSGLYAAGECACTGVHGANRLASNSLLECVVFGGRAATTAVGEPAVPPSLVHDVSSDAVVPVTLDVRASMWQNAGVRRESEALARLAHSYHPIARMIGSAALMRQESRGAHYRTDAPDEDSALRAHIVFQRDAAPLAARWA